MNFYKTILYQLASIKNNMMKTEHREEEKNMNEDKQKIHFPLNSFKRNKQNYTFWFSQIVRG